jgi:hypothetical protein
MSSYDVDEWLRVAKGECSATWELWSRPIETASCLTERGQATAKWAVEKISAFLGDEWLQKSMSGPINSWMWAPWNDVPHTFRRIIELGARIATVAPGKRWRDLKRLARQHTDWEDVLLQLEVAALAVRDGWEAELEPPLPSGKKADLRLSRHGASFLVESTLLGFSQRFQEVNRFSDQAMSALQTIASRNGLAVSGELRNVVDDDRLRSWLDEVASTAEHLRGSRLSAVVAVPGGGEIELSASDNHSARERGLSGPAEASNETPRLVRTLERKARQGAGDEPLWIRLDEGGAIWHLTAPSPQPDRRTMHEALAEIIRTVVDSFLHVAGVVMSEIPMAGTGGRRPEQWMLAGGRGVGLRRPLASGFGREAVMVAGTHRDSAEQLGAWIRWYEGESSWLDWALPYHDQPPLREMIVPPA